MILLGKDIVFLQIPLQVYLMLRMFIDGFTCLLHFWNTYIM